MLPGMEAGQRLGVAAGFLLAPFTGAVALVRRARTFHPEGAVRRAEVAPLPGPLGPVARRLAGPALVRLSSAWWRGGKEWLDALGCAVRFGHSPSAAPQPGDQDLLFATIRSPWTTLLAPLTTEQHDFLANDYYAVSPFQVNGAGRCQLRLVCPRPRGLRGSRGERLQKAVERGEASLQLQLRLEGADWTPLAEIRLLEASPIDQAALRFSPFRDGRGFAPRGFVHGLRVATYALSQLARPRLRESGSRGVLPQRTSGCGS